MASRARLLEIINKQLALPDLNPHWRVALVLQKLEIMGYGHVQLD
jgi:hypothetical protein